jgi:DNA modification methylase
MDWRAGCACGVGSPIPCTVLDPFFGAGTTGVVASEHGRRCIGVELNRDYLTLARQRLREQTAVAAAVQLRDVA